MSLGIVLRRSGIFPAGLSFPSSLPLRLGLEDQEKGIAVEEGVARHGDIEASRPVIDIGKDGTQQPQDHEGSKVLVDEREDEGRDEPGRDRPYPDPQGSKENAPKEKLFGQRRKHRAAEYEEHDRPSLSHLCHLAEGLDQLLRLHLPAEGAAQDELPEDAGKE